ncbi:four helix bundle protein [Saccharicrinis sp. FJH2]|uniref:four helix bundle protein n=1 Tax=Saccharicrinis sp. FJH65 TaxID=3344659 RepID=UPI0035F2DB54
MHNYLELKIWQQARSLVKSIYTLTESIDQNQQYVLISQMQRAVLSIPSNIAEGAGRHTNKEFVRFLSIANGSAFELETQLFLCIDLGYVSEENINPIIKDLKEIQKMIYRLSESLKQNLES